MTASHDRAPKPSPLLALVALGIVLRLRPSWVGIDLGQAAHDEGQSAERISRLVTRAIQPFTQALALLRQRGRPPRASAHDAIETELALTRELLAVTTALLGCVSLKGQRIREHVVGAWQRLSQHAGMTQQRFCQALALPARTLRSWLTHPAKARATTPTPPGPKAEQKKRKRPPRRGRFDFSVMLPDTQIGADTTDISAFGIALKVIAAQDIGGRDEDLFESIVVDDSENAERVMAVLTQAVGAIPGAQAITDQGTPYMAVDTRERLDAMSVEHAPQREGDPLGKATVERAFLTLKSIAAPVLRLTDRVAMAWPPLRDVELATSLTHMLLVALLRAYQHGARAARRAMNARGSIDKDTLARLAEESRERARATERSARLFLEHVHTIYAFAGSARTFIDSLHRYPIAVLHDAERALRSQMHRDDIRDKRSYFAVLVRRFNEEYRRNQQRKERERQDAEQDAKNLVAHRARFAAWANDPCAHLRAALDALALQWQPKDCSLLFDGVGLGLGWMRRALRRLPQLHGKAAIDLTTGVFHAFRLAQLDRLGPHGIAAIEAILQREWACSAPPAITPCTGTDASVILSRTGVNRRRPPCDRLRI
jgi:hypothetical protein